MSDAGRVTPTNYCPYCGANPVVLTSHLNSCTVAASPSSPVASKPTEPAHDSQDSLSAGTVTLRAKEGQLRSSLALLASSPGYQDARLVCQDGAVPSSSLVAALAFPMLGPAMDGRNGGELLVLLPHFTVAEVRGQISALLPGIVFEVAGQVNVKEECAESGGEDAKEDSKYLVDAGEESGEDEIEDEEGELDDEGQWWETSPPQNKSVGKDSTNKPQSKRLGMKYSKKDRKSISLPEFLSEENDDMTCRICEDKFQSLAALLKHKQRYADGARWRCPETGCRRTYLDTWPNSKRTMNLLKVHWKAHYGHKDFACEQCGKTFMTKLGLKLHIPSKHNEGSSEDTFKCTLCPKTFKQDNYLKSHMSRCHTPGNEVTCDLCGKIFKNGTLLKKHMVVHTKELAYSCTECDRRFLRDSALRQHVYSVHNLEKRFKCRCCDKKFSVSKHLARHMKTHTGERPHVCPTCGKGFIQKSNMQIHTYKCVAQ